MKIYDRAGAPNTARVRIALAAKGLEDKVDFVSIDLIGAQQKSDAYLAENPIGKIPLPSRWGRYHPHPSQIRTCAIRRIRFFAGELRSSSSVWMDNPGRWQRVAFQDLV